MLLPSAIQRSDDLVGMATPMVPLSPPSAPELESSSPPQAARASARLPATIVVSSLRMHVLPISPCGCKSVPHPIPVTGALQPLRQTVVRRVPLQLLGQAADRGIGIDQHQ